MLLLDKISTL